MSSGPSDRLSKTPKKGGTGGRATVKSGRSKAGGKPKSAQAGSAPPKPPRLCGACQGKVSLSARYCRHCGRALSLDIPANPHVPPAPKPWRPSRIPKQRPSPESVAVSAHPPEPIRHEAPVPEKTLKPAPAGVPRVWDPVPEVDQRVAQLRVMHDRLRPQLARADLFKRRLRLP